MNTLLPIWFIIILLCCSWGFAPHKKINETAIYLLPTEVAIFYKNYIQQITEKATDPDKRCYIDSTEGPRHYIDLDKYANIDSIPIHWSKAKEKYSERALLAKGIIPWQINRSYLALVDAFKQKDINKIIRHSADLGHYVADAHVPLHTTSNYNGQFTNQIGIHALWETRLPEMFAQQYNLFIGRAQYIPDPLAKAWQIVNESNRLVDSVLMMEKQVAQNSKESDIRAYLERNNQLIFSYSDLYAEKYHTALNGMVERRFTASIYHVASFWYTAWVDAGQPKLKPLIQKQLPAILQDELPIQNKKIIGREEWH